MMEMELNLLLFVGESIATLLLAIFSIPAVKAPSCYDCDACSTKSLDAN